MLIEQLQCFLRITAGKDLKGFLAEEPLAGGEDIFLIIDKQYLAIAHGVGGDNCF